jgi:GWxTD domain-containing protein
MTNATHFRKSLTLPLLIALCSMPLFSAHAQEPTPAHNDPYKKWIQEDVRWIITDQERTDFKNLPDDQKRDHFIEEFWTRRNPTPGAPENTFKEEHYRRLAYANQQFAQGVPGWKTDRGRFYIMYGPPDYVVRHMRSDKTQRLYILKREFNSEEWHWIHIDGLGNDIIFEFEDTCGCGEYRLTRAENGPNQRQPGPPPPPAPAWPRLINQVFFP